MDPAFASSRSAAFWKPYFTENVPPVPSVPVTVPETVWPVGATSVGQPIARSPIALPLRMSGFTISIPNMPGSATRSAPGMSTPGP